MIDYTTWSDEDLAVEADRLAEERTRVRLQQNAVSAEADLRRMMKGMSGAAREALTIRLEGGVAPKSATVTKGTNA